MRSRHVFSAHQRAQQRRPAAKIVKIVKACHQRRLASPQLSGLPQIWVPSGGTATLTDNATPLTLGRTTPDALFLAMPEREFEACDPNGALGADGLGLLGVLLVLRIERFRIKAAARTEIKPRRLRRPELR